MDLGLSHCAQWLTVYPLIQVIFFLLSPFCQVLLFSCNSMAKFTYANSCHSFNSLSHLNVCIVQYLLSCLLQTGFLCCKLIKADCWHTKCMQEVRVLQRCPDFFTVLHNGMHLEQRHRIVYGCVFYHYKIHIMVWINLKCAMSATSVQCPKRLAIRLPAHPKKMVA